MEHSTVINTSLSETLALSRLLKSPINGITMQITPPDTPAHRGTHQYGAIRPGMVAGTQSSTRKLPLFRSKFKYSLTEKKRKQHLLERSISNLMAVEIELLLILSMKHFQKEKKRNQRRRRKRKRKNQNPMTIIMLSRNNKSIP